MHTFNSDAEQHCLCSSLFYEHICTCIVIATIIQYPISYIVHTKIQVHGLCVRMMNVLFSYLQTRTHSQLFLHLIEDIANTMDDVDFPSLGKSFVSPAVMASLLGLPVALNRRK